MSDRHSTADGEQVTAHEAIWQRIATNRVMPIVRLSDVLPLLDIVRALHEGGIRVIEFPLTTPGALDAVAACRAHYPDVVVGVGTVHSVSDARRSLDAGAQFLASYAFNESMIDAAHQHGVPAFPAAMTPTEIVTARDAGADAVKVFPARVLGSDYISLLRAPLAHIPLLPSGGIAAAEVPNYLQAGAEAVGVSDLVEPGAVRKADWAAITTRARALVEATHPQVISVGR
ncbi:bifunctional 4-hydroxy-2-oxoglutarate aldolase/2-dehydro-3-deoxy-phosphogluconate aldolase [Nocardia sp. NPDC088792]|uniref:bifunctional 4-hydroxy-2-oxoglutarate aldolase/2-dehydro-3-deoxy-phosphogluconate aldolase n=1 Tax=Nocardia sp. NPDC088792 TaxID=3364332 RepID=UPI00381C2B6D